jgi:hypothetical protein
MMVIQKKECVDGLVTSRQGWPDGRCLGLILDPKLHKAGFFMRLLPRFYAYIPTFSRMMLLQRLLSLLLVLVLVSLSRFVHMVPSAINTLVSKVLFG